jgi:alpha/beta superfamily hydrolase
VGHARRLWIEGPEGRLEAALRIATPARAAAVLAHPHPLHGGTLDNPVSFHADRALNGAGFTTLRFNFRGTGSSEGEHDDGRGEADDVALAAAWLRGVAPEVPLLLVGYSFGALCSLRYAVRNEPVAGVIAIGLPVRMFPTDEIDDLSCPLAVVQGSADELGSPDEVRTRVGNAAHAVDIRVVDGATHFFAGHAAEAAEAVVAAAHTLLAGASGIALEGVKS